MNIKVINDKNFSFYKTEYNNNNISIADFAIKVGVSIPTLKKILNDLEDHTT